MPSAVTWEHLEELPFETVFRDYQGYEWEIVPTPWHRSLIWGKIVAIPDHYEPTDEHYLGRTCMLSPCALREVVTQPYASWAHYMAAHLPQRLPRDRAWFDVDDVLRIGEWHWTNHQYRHAYAALRAMVDQGLAINVYEAKGLFDTDRYELVFDCTAV